MIDSTVKFFAWLAVQTSCWTADLCCSAAICAVQIMKKQHHFLSVAIWRSSFGAKLFHKLFFFSSMKWPARLLRVPRIWKRITAKGFYSGKSMETLLIKNFSLHDMRTFTGQWQRNTVIDDLQEQYINLNSYFNSEFQSDWIDVQLIIASTTLSSSTARHARSINFNRISSPWLQAANQSKTHASIRNPCLGIWKFWVTNDSIMQDIPITHWQEWLIV